MSSKTKTLAPKEDGKPALVPKLRFAEFIDAAEGWKPSVLADACDMQAGKFVSASNISERNQAGMFPCYGGNGLRGYTTTNTHDGTYPLIGRQGALCGNVRLASGQFHATEHAVVATPKESIDVGWLYYSLDLLNLNRFATGQAQPGLSVDVLENVSLAIPPLEPEQQRIASCLSSLDELIGAQARKVDALKTHKKGLMQQLFPREGETQPRLRFPEFEGEWEERRLGDVATFHKGKGISKADISINGRTPCIRYGELYTVYGEIVDNVQSRTDIPVADLFLSQNNDVIIPASGETRLDIAKAACVIHDDVALGGDLNVIRTSHRGVFLSYYLNGPKRYDIAKVAQGDTVAHLYPSQLKKLVVSLPSEAEQQRIASCLSSLDDLITNEINKLETYKTHKKGLMQGLFPKVGESTT